MKDELTPADRELLESIRLAYRPYRLPPREQPARRRWPLFSAAAAVVTAGIAVVMVLTTPPSAVASWTTSPTSSDPNALPDATEDACRQQAATLLRVGEQAGWPDDPSLRAMRKVPLVAYDERGEASAALFADRASWSVWICAIVPVPGQPPYVELGGGSGVIPDEFGPVEVWTATGGWNSDYGGRWEIAGRVDRAVERLTVVTEDGRRVVATIDDGWFLAWWPSEAEPVRIDLETGEGDPVDSIDLGGRYAHEPSCKLSFRDRLCLWR